MYVALVHGSLLMHVRNYVFLDEGFNKLKTYLNNE